MNRQTLIVVLGDRGMEAIALLERNGFEVTTARSVLRAPLQPAQAREPTSTSRSTDLSKSP